MSKLLRMRDHVRTYPRILKHKHIRIYAHTKTDFICIFKIQRSTCLTFEKITAEYILFVLSKYQKNKPFPLKKILF